MRAQRETAAGYRTANDHVIPAAVNHQSAGTGSAVGSPTSSRDARFHALIRPLQAERSQPVSSPDVHIGDETVPRKIRLIGKIFSPKRADLTVIAGNGQHPGFVTEGDTRDRHAQIPATGLLIPGWPNPEIAFLGTQTGHACPPGCRHDDRTRHGNRNGTVPGLTVSIDHETFPAVGYPPVFGLTRPTNQSAK